MESLYNGLVLLCRVSYPHLLVHVGRSVDVYHCCVGWGEWGQWVMVG